MKLLAVDGLPARPAGIWTREKLAYLEKYARAFMTAMAPKRAQGKWSSLIYVDILCGPGRDIDTDNDEEFQGSPLIALSIEPRFDRLFLADKSKRNIGALEKRIPPVDKQRVSIQVGDCNLVVDEILNKIPRRSLGLAFVDPQGFEVDFTTLAKLARARIDLLYLFPSGIGMKRNLRNLLPVPDSRIDKFWGGKDWRELPEARRIAGASRRIEQDKVIESLVPAFRQKLRRAGFNHQDEAPPLFTNTKNAQMYHLLYLSHDETGLTIWKKTKKIAPGGQRTLF